MPVRLHFVDSYMSKHRLILKWFTGANFGSIISFPLSGWLCTLEWGGGWPLCFYIFGGIGIVWFVAWIFLVYDTPQSHPRICPRELDYIKWTIGSHVCQMLYEYESLIKLCCFNLKKWLFQMEHKPGPIPWGHFLRCMPLWAILITQCGLSWQFYTQLTELPTYMNNILHMKLQQVLFVLFSFIFHKFQCFLIEKLYI